MCLEKKDQYGAAWLMWKVLVQTEGRRVEITTHDQKQSHLSIRVMVKSGLLACGCLLYCVLCVSVSEMH